MAVFFTVYFTRKGIMIYETPNGAGSKQYTKIYYADAADFTKTGAFFGRDEGLSYSDGAKTQ